MEWASAVAKWSGCRMCIILINCICIPRSRVGVSQQFIPAPQELCLIFRMREPLFLRAQLRALLFGLQLVLCVPRMPRDSLVMSRGGLVCGNEGRTLEGMNTRSIHGECVLFMFENG